MDGFDVLRCHGCASGAGACGIERLQGEWLDLMCCGVSRTGACGIERLHGGWLVLMCCGDTCVSSACEMQKPNGRGIRALVVGDALGRLVGRTLAQASAPYFEHACLPHQYGPSTRAGGEALPRVLRAAAEGDARAIILFFF